MNLYTTIVFFKTIKAILDGYTIIIHEGSTRSSKTFSAIQAATVLTAKFKGMRTIFVAVTLQMAKKNLLKASREIIGKLWNILGKWKVSDMTYEWKNTSETFYLSAENPDKYHGLDSDIAVLDEPNLYKEGDKIFEQISIRNRGVIILCMNPSRKLDWILEILKRPDAIYIHSTYKDNRFLHKRTIKNIEAKGAVNERFKKVYMEGVYMADAERSIYTNWYLTDEFPKDEECSKILYGLDYGFDPDPTVLIKVAFFDSKIYIREIFRGQKLETSEIYQKIKRMIPSGSVIIADNSEKRITNRLNIMLKNDGIQILKARKPKEHKKNGIKELQEQELWIYSKSGDTITEFENYSKKKINGEIKPEPEDKDDHAPDALLYVWNYHSQGYAVTI